MVDPSLLRFLESCPEQSRIAPFPIGDGTCLKEWFLLDGKAYTVRSLDHLDLYGLLDYGQWEPDWKQETQEMWSTAAETVANIGITIAENLADREKLDDLWNFDIATENIAVNWNEPITRSGDAARAWVHENRDWLGSLMQDALAVAAVGKVCDSVIKERWVASSISELGGIKNGIRIIDHGIETVSTLIPKQIKEVVNIKGFTAHAVDRAIFRGVSPQSILDALKNPLKTNSIKIDSLGRPSQRIIGQHTEVVINPQSKQILSVNPTSSKKAKKLAR